MNVRWQYLLITLLFISCNPDLDPIGMDCMDYSTDSPWGFEFTSPYTNYERACFNPNNDQQFVYRTSNSATTTYEVRIYDLSTQSGTLIYSGLTIQQLVWTDTDWIVFATAGKDILKIRPDGSSLGILEDTYTNNWPSYNSFTNSISFFHQQNNDFTLSYCGVYSLTDHSLVDSIYFYQYPGSSGWADHRWVSATDVVAVSGDNYSNYGIYSFNIPTKTRTEITKVNVGNGGDGFSFVFSLTTAPNSSFIIWSNGYALNRTDISTKNTYKIKNSCMSVSYLSYSVSPDNSKILAERMERTQINSNTIEERSRIVLMNVDGSNEQVIELP